MLYGCRRPESSKWLRSKWLASEGGGEPGVCGLMKAKQRKYFKCKGIINDVKCCWEGKRRPELTIRFGKVEVMGGLNKNSFSSVLRIKVCLKGVQRRSWGKALLTASLDSSVEKFYYKEELGNVSEFGGGWKVKGGLSSRWKKTVCLYNDGYDAIKRKNWLGKRERG